MKTHKLALAIFATILIAACSPEPVSLKSGSEAPKPETTETALDMTAWKDRQPNWFEPAEPFRLIGNIYFVGTQGLAVYLITDDNGHILIDGGMPGEEYQIINNIRSIGFDPMDVQIILNTHAHFDHSGGLAKLKHITGAKLHAMKGDVSALEGGFYLGSEGVDNLRAPPVKVDKIIHDGDKTTMGDTHLTAHHTPGHSRGCTSWWTSAEEAGQSYSVMNFCSATVAANKLLDPPQYDGIVEDYRTTFAKTKDWKPDVFLAAHSEFFKMVDKRKTQIVGNPLAFVNPDEFPEFIQRMETRFEKELKAQKTARDD